jgi:hypothetical protein
MLIVSCFKSKQYVITYETMFKIYVITIRIGMASLKQFPREQSGRSMKLTTHLQEPRLIVNFHDVVLGTGAALFLSFVIQKNIGLMNCPRDVYVYTA